MLTYHPDLPNVRDIVNKSGPSMSPLALWARSSQKDRPWAREDTRVCGMFLYMPSSNQTCVMMNHLGRHDRAAKQDAKHLQIDNPTQIAKSASGATIKLRCNTSCKTTNVVYLITCTVWKTICWRNQWSCEPTDERPPGWLETQAVREVSCRALLLRT